MPLGLNLAPLQFTTLVKELRDLASPRVRSSSEHMYLDDWLNRAMTFPKAAHVTLKLLRLIVLLGILLNFEKPALIPSQIFNYLGYRYDLMQDLVYPVQTRIDYLTQSHGQFRMGQALQGTGYPCLDRFPQQ